MKQSKYDFENTRREWSITGLVGFKPFVEEVYSLYTGRTYKIQRNATKPRKTS